MAEQAPTDRRRLLQAAAALAVAAWAPRQAASQPRWPDSPFALGVASGSPAADSVVLWTRLTGPSLPAEPVAVRWEIADDEGFTRVAQQGVAQAAAELAHSVHVEAQGLAPDRWYFYRFIAGGWASPAGRTRTLPAPDAIVARLRLAYASCQRWEHGYYAAWRHLRAEQPDLVLFLGDYIYEYPGSLNAVRSVDGGWAHSLADYRRRHAQYKSDPDLQAAHAAAPWLLAWDDHEVQNDYAGAHPGNAGPPVADFAARRAAAYQAYYEHMPLRASTFARAVAGGSLGLHSQQRYGRLAALHVLDGRQHRDAQVCTPAGRPGSGTFDPSLCPEWHDPSRTLLGAAQERWLEGQLARAGDVQWTVLGQGTLFGQRRRPGSGPTRLWNDGWDGYPHARRRLTQALQQLRAPNPVLFGGDVHENWVGQVKADYDRAGSADIGVEFCGTSITSRASNASIAAVAPRLAANPHYTFADAQHRGYGIADFSPQRLEVGLRVLDDPARADSGVRTLARFAVVAGRARVERA